MRETRSSGSVEGVMSNRDPYSDFTYQLRLALAARHGQTALYLSHLTQQSLQYLGKRNLSQNHGQHRNRNRQNERDESCPVKGKRLQMFNVLVAGPVIREGAWFRRGWELLFATSAMHDPPVVKLRAL